MVIRTVIACLALLGFVFGGAGTASAQAPTLPGHSPLPPGSTQSSLGATPGAGMVPFGNAPGAGQDVLGGRVGTAFPRVPTAITNPSAGQMTRPGVATLAPSATLPAPAIPHYGRMELPSGPESEGPPNGLTLDAAIERLVHHNLDIRSRYFEIPQAQADVLTASLRNNPIFYADSQLIPYGGFSNQRPGGPTQYDINVTHPIDVNHKRRYRIDSAVKARKVLEAQYQDFVRQQIGNLYLAFVDVLSARETNRYAEGRVNGLKTAVGVIRKQFQLDKATQADVEKMEVQLDFAEMTLMDEQHKYRRTRQTLGTLLQLTPGEADALELRGSVRVSTPPLPELDSLIQNALNNRPDLAAYRLGIQRAEADVRLARANRYQDVYLLLQPYTFQNNAPFGKESAHSWAVGMTVPLPLYNRNQGVIQRARLNVNQTQLERLDLERKIVNEVIQAHGEYALTHRITERFEQGLLGRAKAMRDNTQRLFTAGETPDVLPYLEAERLYNDYLRQYTDLAVRYRRSTLNLNTAVGQRFLP
jgi:outer membrane protein, heavy metal efflux system